MEAPLDILEQIKLANSTIRDIYLPKGAKDGQMVLVAIEKQHPGEGQQVIAEIWSSLSPLVDPKFVVVVDDDVNVRDWNDVIWAITTRMDPARDSLLERSSGVGRIALDATNKLGNEASREWGIPIKKDPLLVDKIDAIWHQLDL
ncbi:UbiD family decarboxylase [Vibrio renipiscarius]|uniref:hypothetical protein n=1 Tax=Vibrio renipiscarius TaxID=1461322 RepID=UPI0035590EF3